MAEFTEVMKQAARMCKDLTCVNCSMWLEKEEVCGFKLPFNPDFEEVEKDVMEWAEENPEKSEPPKWVYPSWEKAWKILFPNAKRTPCPNLYFGCECIYEGCPNCAMQPMPAEVAEKLGIKPTVKEGKS